MGFVTAQADQRGLRGADDTALGRLSGQPSRRSRPLSQILAAPFQSGCASSGHIVWLRGELLVEVLRGNSRRFEMNPLLTLYFSGGTSLAGLGLVKLQARLERWSYERHVED
jgi:hypothetical protein